MSAAAVQLSAAAVPAAFDGGLPATAASEASAAAAGSPSEAPDACEPHWLPEPGVFGSPTEAMAHEPDDSTVLMSAKKTLGRTHLWHWRNVPKFPHCRDEDMPIAVWLDRAEGRGSEGDSSEETEGRSLLIIIILLLLVFIVPLLFIAFAPESSLPKHHHHGNNKTYTRQELFEGLAFY